MGLPQLLSRILIQGSSILGKAFMEGARQGVRNFKSTGPDSTAAAGTAPGQGSGNSVTDKLTRDYKMTVEEARMILNVKAKEGEPLEEFRARLDKSYESLFTINAPPAPKGKEGGGSGSIYMQAKVFRAKERIEAEWKDASKESEGPAATASESTTTAPPPPPKEGGS